MQTTQRLVIVSVAGAFCLWGVVGVLIGALLPDIRHAFSLSTTQAGILIGVWSASFVVGSWVSARCVRLFRLNTIFVTASAIALLSFAALYLASTIRLFAPAFVLIGVIMGISVTIGHSLIGASFPERRTSMLSALDVVFTLGSICAPLGVIALSTGGLDWQVFYLVLSGAFAILVIGLAAFLPPMTAPDEARQDAGAKKAGAFSESYLVLLGLTGLFLGTVEWAQNSWIVSFALVENASEFTAQIGFATYLGGMLIVRIMTVFTATLLQSGRTPLYLLSLALIGNVMLIYGPNIVTMMAGNLLIGLGIGAIFPIALGRAMDFDPAKAASASATLLMGVIAGSQIAAVFLGWLADQVGGIGMAFRATTPFFILLIICFAGFRLRSERNTVRSARDTSL